MIAAKLRFTLTSFLTLGMGESPFKVDDKVLYTESFCTNIS